MITDWLKKETKSLTSKATKSKIENQETKANLTKPKGYTMTKAHQIREEDGQVKAKAIEKIIDNILETIMLGMMSCGLILLPIIAIMEAPAVSRLDNAFLVGICAFFGVLTVLIAIKIEVGRLANRA